MSARQNETENRFPGDPSTFSRNRQIVVCCDGTSNTLTGGVKDTNVLQLHELLRFERERLRQEQPNGPQQVAYYDPGVGSAVGLPPTGVTGVVTESLRRLGGLALGSGIYDNIAEAYLFLCREYGRLSEDAPGTKDEIWLFGFSRGAFTVRAVAGMVNLFGLIRPEHEVLLPTLLRVYFAADGDAPTAGEVGAENSLPDGRAAAADGEAAITTVPKAMAARVSGSAVKAIEALRIAMDQQPRVMIESGEDHRVESAQLTRAAVAEQIRRDFTSGIGRNAWIHFLGVWDTVDSVGILPGSRKRISSAPTIHKNRYRHVRHALALDEHRRQFLPRYFDGQINRNQTLEQVWFRGGHGDIGGSRPVQDSLLSWETFKWMTDEAIERGLRLTPVERHLDESTIVEVIGDQLRAQPAWALTGMALRDPSRVAGRGHLGPAPTDDERLARALDAPREHGSVKLFARDGPDSCTAGVPGSPWDPGNGPRKRALAINVMLVAFTGWLFLLAAGALATPGPAGWAIGSSTEAGARLFWSQLSLFWPSGIDGVSGIGERLEPASARFERWAAADTARDHASYGWAQLFTAGFTLALAVLLARIPARAFSELTRWRSIRDPYPSPRWLMNGLGLGYAVMVLAVVVQTLLLVVAWDVGRSSIRWPLLAAAAEASVIAGLGALATIVLIGWWIPRAVAARWSHRRRKVVDGT